MTQPPGLPRRRDETHMNQNVIKTLLRIDSIARRAGEAA